MKIKLEIECENKAELMEVLGGMPEFSIPPEAKLNDVGVFQDVPKLPKGSKLSVNPVAQVEKARMTDERLALELLLGCGHYGKTGISLSTAYRRIRRLTGCSQEVAVKRLDALVKAKRASVSHKRVHEPGSLTGRKRDGQRGKWARKAAPAPAVV